VGILFFGNVENQVARPIERLEVTFNSGASADASEVWSGAIEMMNFRSMAFCRKSGLNTCS